MVKRLVEAQEKVARVHPDPSRGAVVQRKDNWMAFIAVSATGLCLAVLIAGDLKDPLRVLFQFRRSRSSRLQIRARRSMADRRYDKPKTGVRFPPRAIPGSSLNGRALASQARF